MFDDAVVQAEISPKIWAANDALNTSIRSIIEDDEVSDKGALLSATLEEFKTHILTFIAGTIAKCGFRPAKAQGDTMPDAILNLLGLEKGATEAEISAAVTKLAAAGAAASEAAGTVAKLEASLVIEKMSDAEKAFCAEMDDTAKAAFAAKTPDERKAMMTKKADVDPEIAKRDAELVDLRKRVEAGEDERALATVTKRVEVLKHVGEADAPTRIRVGSHLQIAKADPALAEAVEKKFEQIDAVLAKSALFGEFGSGRAGVTKATTAIAAKAEELKKSNPAWSIEKARVEARKQNPDLAKQESDEAAQARADRRQAA